MKKDELEAYAENFHKKEFDLSTGSIMKLSKDEQYSNLQESRNRKAWNNASWIDYWRALTNEYDNKLSCACCGKTIFADIRDSQCQELVKVRQLAGEECSAEMYQAEGGHVRPNFEDEYYDGVYIVPLCRTCNYHNNHNLTLRKGSILCPEVKK